MQITDFSHQPSSLPTQQGYLALEGLVAASFFLLPALLLFILSAK